MKRSAFPIISFLAVAASALSGCDEKIPMVNLGIDDAYYIYRMQKLPLESALTGAEYRWTLHRDNRPDSVISTRRDCLFLAGEEGRYSLSFDIIDEATPYHHDFTVDVLHEEVEYSPYIAKVYEFCPAPGQFVNDMPRYAEGDTYEDMIRKVEESICGTTEVMVSLGAYGGYVTFGFDHTVVNVPGEYDFRIWGNAFYELNKPEEKGGSAEPGIVYVSYDVNCNGKPDDAWYELAGSEYYKPETLHDYTITYAKPDPARQPVSDGFLTDIHYIGWTDSQGESGYMAKNSFHKQEYYPQWVDDATLTFTGTRLAPNGVDQSGNGSYYVLYSYDWGYVDNHPNDYAELNSFDISWAVDRNGVPVHLPGVDFIRVMTGVNQYCGWTGETSTELSKAQDLHIEDTGVVAL